jgi:hypothetical protein
MSSQVGQVRHIGAGVPYNRLRLCVRAWSDYGGMCPNLPYLPYLPPWQKLLWLGGSAFGHKKRHPKVPLCLVSSAPGRA